MQARERRRPALLRRERQPSVVRSRAVEHQRRVACMGQGSRAHERNRDHRALRMRRPGRCGPVRRMGRALRRRMAPRRGSWRRGAARLNVERTGVPCRRRLLRRRGPGRVRGGRIRRGVSPPRRRLWRVFHRPERRRRERQPLLRSFRVHGRVLVEGGRQRQGGDCRQQSLHHEDGRHLVFLPERKQERRTPLLQLPPRRRPRATG